MNLRDLQAKTKVPAFVVFPEICGFITPASRLITSGWRYLLNCHACDKISGAAIAKEDEFRDQSFKV